MRESEVKIFDVDQEKVLEALRGHGGQGPYKIFDGYMDIVYFDSVHQLLRVRREVNQTCVPNDISSWMTVKKKVLGSHGVLKVLDEVNVKVELFDEACSFMEAMGYQSTLEIRKKRTSYMYRLDDEGIFDAAKQIRFDFDKVVDEGLSWLEIEPPEDQLLGDVLRIIGYTYDDCSAKTTDEIVTS